MYDISRRTKFVTLGDLRALTANLPDDTKIYAGGADPWFHIEKDNSCICIDDESLYQYYEEDEGNDN